MTSVAEYRASRELFSNLTLRELRSKYKRSFLGWTWSLVNPLANMVVYTVVFSVFLHAHPPKGDPSGLTEYALWLLCALLPWTFFVSSVMGSVGGLIGNGNLIKKTWFPRELLPASSTAANLVSHLIEMGLLLVVLLAFGNWRALVYLPVTLVLVAVMFTLALGFGLLFSVLNVYFRDIEHFLGLLFLIWFYATPIVYPTTVIHSTKIIDVLNVNPMTSMAASFRATLFDGRLPGLLHVVYFVSFAVVMLVIGLIVFNRLQSRLAEEL
jgi:ABC-2 type transport system permease protein